MLEAENDWRKLDVLESIYIRREWDNERKRDRLMNREEGPLKSNLLDLFG